LKPEEISGMSVQLGWPCQHRLGAASAVLMLLFAMSALSACSAMMALEGEGSHPDLSFKVGSTRQDVESVLGPPETAKVLEDGNIETRYIYEVDESEPVCALRWLMGGIFSLGFTELVGTPYLVLYDDAVWEVFFVYDSDGIFVRRKIGPFCIENCSSSISRKC
jgi:hypothetical protein